MKKVTRSILEELNSLNFNKDRESLIETTGANLIQNISTHYSDEEALELERRFINSIKTGDARKFHRGITKIKESRKNDS